MNLNWQSPKELPPRAYDCGHCGKHTGPASGYFGQMDDFGKLRMAFVYLCTYCRQPTYFDPYGGQIPGPAPGGSVADVPEQVNELYEQARRCAAANAPTAAAMACRKVLMNVAVDHGADANQSFAYYVDWLNDNGYISPKGKGWVGRIRAIGNDANHEIPDIEPADANRVLVFTEMLLKVLYEFPAAGEEPESAS